MAPQVALFIWFYIPNHSTEIFYNLSELCISIGFEGRPNIFYFSVYKNTAHTGKYPKVIEIPRNMGNFVSSADLCWDKGQLTRNTDFPGNMGL
jgi:hypothetical protein